MIYPGENVPTGVIETRQGSVATDWGELEKDDDLVINDVCFTSGGKTIKQDSKWHRPVPVRRLISHWDRKGYRYFRCMLGHVCCPYRKEHYVDGEEIS